MTSTSLAGDWALTDTDGGNACTLILPGDGISALHDAGLIADPYWGRNEYGLRWICERDWVAKRCVELTETEVDLVLSEIDTVATVRVNNVVVLEARNAFRGHRVSLAHVAKVGTNEISITFHSPVAAGKALQDAHPFEIPWSNNCPIPYGNFIRKPACDFGWDWNIALAPFGVYGALRIEPAKAARIDAVHVSQDHRAGAVDLTLRARVANAKEATFAIAGQELTTFVTDGQAQVTLTIDNPDLWWPAGQGGQPLYDLTVRAGEAVATRRIGLRTMELVTEADAVGLGFKIRVNGRDIFCKGANWIPADALPGRISEDKTNALLQSAVDANMNMVRVWGGGRYEPTSFYDTCDELGLMVWQDFMFACNLYPSDPDYLSEVKEEIRFNVARMQHHASLALWCGDNELVGALTWYDVALADRDRYLVNYDRLNRTIEETLLDVDPTANWWPSSPSPGPLSFGDAWHDDSSGDMHFWSVWHEGRDFDHYRDVAPRFCSEFGFQSYPSMSAIRQFAGPQDMNIAAPVLESHQKNEGGNARIAETMFRYFRWPEKFEDFVYLSQVQQALAIKTAVTHWRSLKPHCMGTLIWQLNDTWPVCSWASLNYDGEWKLLHYAAQDFFADVIVTAVPTDDGIVLRGVNDAPEPQVVSLHLRAVTPAGKSRDLARRTETIAAPAMDLTRLDPGALEADELLVVDWHCDIGSGREVFAPAPYKSYDLQPSGATFTTTREGDDHVLTVTATGLSLFTMLEADIPGRWQGNAFDILPNESCTAIFTPADPTMTPQFTLRDLHSATTAKDTDHA